MANTHAKLSARVGGDAEYKFRGRNTGGKLHKRGDARRVREEAKASGYVSDAQVIHVEQVETELEASIVAALERAEAMIVANREVVAEAQYARLEAASNIAPFVSAAEGQRGRLIAAGLVQEA